MRESTSRICILLFWLLVNCIPSITQSFFHSTANLQLNTQIHASALSPELPMMLRLERILANRGLGSRAEVLALIKAGRVRTVDGQIIRSAAGKFPSNISIMVNEKLSQQAPLLACFHKPFGVLSSVGDPWGRPNLEQMMDSHLILKQMHPVGRLDADTTGLLLFSREGKLTQTLLNPSTKIDREYEALVEGKVNLLSLKEKLAQGVVTSDGTFPAVLLESFTFDHPEDCSYIQKIIEQLTEPSSKKARDEDNEFDLTSRSRQLSAFSYVKLSVTEGKYRMVRRILHNAGHSVLLLHRTRYGFIELGHSERTSCATKKRIQDLWPPQTDLVPGLIRPCYESEQMWAAKLFKS